MTDARSLLVQKFEARNIDAALKHFAAAVEKYARRDWDGVALKVGKFVEAITKALMTYCSRPIGNPRQFKAGHELKQLEQLPGNAYPDTVRIVVPKACIFAYEIANNRGGRHDAHDIDANEMDAKSLIPVISWVLAEMVRFCASGMNSDAAMLLIDGLMDKTYPYFEEIDGRPYVNIPGLSPGQIALLLLYSRYPQKVDRQKLTEFVLRHGCSKSATDKALQRLKGLVDDDNGEWKLRGLGREKAEELLGAIEA